MKRVTGPNWKDHWTTYVKYCLAEKFPDMSTKDIVTLTEGLQKYLGIGIGVSAGVTPWLRGLVNNPLADP
ncbi:MAG: hypothetical protein ACC656_13975, partial [Candidatus Heimdallarchaeota archaeon]